jgi:hypothetical protein
MTTISAIYRSLPADIPRRLKDSFSHGLAGREAIIFFRADDVGVPGHNYNRMLALFVDCGIPLSLAVVPAWLTRARWRTLQAPAAGRMELFCWHQHGWRHVNHEREGKQQEFGGGRDAQAIYADIKRGKERLVGIMGDRFTPIFTPPWNRCSRVTIECLQRLGFMGISRSPDGHPPPLEGLTEFPVALDLHTRKEKDANLGWERLFNELHGALQSGFCGIMLHHQRMNAAAFRFLELLLQCVIDCSRVRPIHPGQLIPDFDYLGI